MCIIKDLCEYPDKTAPKEVSRSDAPVVRKVGRKTAARKRRRPGKLL